MKKREIKLISIIMSFLIIFSMSFVFAGGAGSDEEVIASISNSILDVLLWAAYVIALGVLLMSAIKYMMSGANEKANLKGMLPKYLIGIVAITCCFIIAQFVAELAGNDKAEEIIDVSQKLGINFVGSTDGTGGADTEQDCSVLGHDMKYERALEMRDGHGYALYKCTRCAATEERQSEGRKSPRAICAEEGHIMEYERGLDIRDGHSYALYKCSRCGQSEERQTDNAGRRNGR